MELKDVLHLYLGCDCIIGDLNWKPQDIHMSDLEPYTNVNLGAPIKCKMDYHTLMTYGHKTTPILRPLSDMTEEEVAKIFELSMGVYEQKYAPPERLSNTEWLFTIGSMQYKIGFYDCSENDVRIGSGISMFLKSYLIEDRLSVGESGITSDESHFNKEKTLVIENINLIFTYILSKHFDLFGLIESGQAINKNTL